MENSAFYIPLKDDYHDCYHVKVPRSPAVRKSFNFVQLRMGWHYLETNATEFSWSSIL